MIRYRDVVSDTSATSADGLIRAAIDRNKLTGDDRFIDEVERRIGIRVSLCGPGRARGEK